MQDIILDRKVKFVNLSIYWIGYKLRDLNFDLAPLSVQHSDILLKVALKTTTSESNQINI
jgi:hypothetical protein